MEYGFRERQEAVRRAMVAAAPMRIENVAYEVQPETGKRVFACSTIHATLSVESCVAQFSRGFASCIGCAVGKVHSAGVAPTRVRAEPGKPVYVGPQQSCIRCGRDGSDAHSARLIGRLRTVQRISALLKGAADATSCCISCFNRQKEVISGINSKGKTPKKHACLREATITYTVDGVRHENVDSGLRSGVPEIRRLLERGYPEAKVELIEAIFGGVAADLDSTADPLWLADKPAKPKATPRECTTLKPLPVASDREIVKTAALATALAADPLAFRAPFKAVAPVTERESVGDAANPTVSQLAASHGISLRLAYYRLKTRGTVEVDTDPNGSVLHINNTSGVNGVSFVEKRNKWVVSGCRQARLIHIGYFDTIEEATAARASFNSESSEPPAPVTNDYDEPQDESEWAGCGVTGEDGKTTFVTDYARANDISDQAAAIELGMTDPDYDDEPSPALTPEPDPVPESEPDPIPNRLTGKQMRKLEKAARRAAREADQAARHRPDTKPAPLAVTCRAFVHVMYELGGRK